MSGESLLGAVSKSEPRWRVDAFCPVCRKRVGFRRHVPNADAQLFGAIKTIVQMCKKHGCVDCRPVWTLEPAVRLRLVQGGKL